MDQLEALGEFAQMGMSHFAEIVVGIVHILDIMLSAYIVCSVHIVYNSYHTCHLYLVYFVQILQNVYSVDVPVDSPN